MDSASEFLFGTCVDSLKANIPYAHNVAFPPPQSSSAEAQTANIFLEAFNESMQIIAEREHLGHIWPLFEFFKDATEAPMKIVSAFLDPVIHAAVEKKKLAETEKSDVEADTLLDELLNSTSGMLPCVRSCGVLRAFVDPKILKDETCVSLCRSLQHTLMISRLNILLAGRDTTMHVMTMVVYLCVHPVFSDDCHLSAVQPVHVSRRLQPPPRRNPHARRGNPTPDLRRHQRHEVPPSGHKRCIPSSSPSAPLLIEMQSLCGCILLCESQYLA
jgi:hypothetical protein